MNETIIYRIKNQYNQIDFLLKGLPEAFIKKRVRAQKWSIHENLAHLGRYQEIYIERIDAILKNNSPSFERYTSELDPSFHTWIPLTTETIIEKTKQDRRVIYERLVLMNEIQLEREGVHPKLRQMNISEWTEFFLLHETHHFYTIFWLTQEFGD